MNGALFLNPIQYVCSDVTPRFVFAETSKFDIVKQVMQHMHVVANSKNEERELCNGELYLAMVNTTPFFSDYKMFYFLNYMYLDVF
jgi:hypothetical protein